MVLAASLIEQYFIHLVVVRHYLKQAKIYCIWTKT